MRISDWSSDVCSSDLAGRGEVARGVVLVGVEAHHDTRGDPELSGQERHGAGILLVVADHLISLQQGRDPLGTMPGAREDRQGVVSGTSVAVRVDLGGRRNIKKTTTNQKIQTKT